MIDIQKMLINPFFSLYRHWLKPAAIYSNQVSIFKRPVWGEKLSFKLSEDVFIP